MNPSAKAKPADEKYLHDILLGLAPFYYWPNEGNLGDYLIAEATRQFFRRMGINWKEYDPLSPPEEEQYTLVYGGGGRFVPYWAGMERFEEHLTRHRVQKCVILPHSIHGVDSFVRALDERHCVFCRDHKTHMYCESLNTKAAFTLAHDMGMSLDVDTLPAWKQDEETEQNMTGETAGQYALLSGATGLYARSRMRRATVTAPGTARKVAFLLRTDAEKSTTEQAKWSYDLSLLYSGSCRETPYTAKLVRLMADLLRYPDVVVTDRLHVAIMAMHVGKDVYMLDNDYGKLSGVYEVSLKDKPNVHLLPLGEPWPRELQGAWRKLNSPYRRAYYAALACGRKIINKLKGK